jgi:TonB family protein
METIRRNRKIAIITFLLSLLFHASFMIYLIVQKSDYLNTPLPQENALNPEQAQDKQWAETKARASNFGAPVLFEDAPSAIEEPKADVTPDNIKSEKEEPAEQETSELERSIDIPNPEKIVAQLPAQQETTMQRPQRTRPPRKKDIQHVQRQRTATQSTQQLSMPKSKQVPTLAQLTQGFLHQPKDEGTHTVHMLGNRKGLPTDEQMKYERYLQKLSWCLQNSFNINNSRFPSSERTETEVQLFLALDKDGRIKKLDVAQSSGSRQLDQFVLFVFRDAGSSFPPVPQYLPHNPFTIMYTVMLNSSDNNFRIYKRS